jgi:L-alanine-DL-glutamate epimerase-like enolase superfamily enzyme
MKIESIKATPVTIAFIEPEIWSQGVREGVTAVVVQVITDQGLVGIGESVPAPSPPITLAAIESAAEALIGKDPRRVVQRWHDMQSQSGFVSFPYTGNAALAGIEMACWDILGKSLDAPVHALLGGRIRDQIPIMGFVQNTTPDQIEADARRMADEGYTTLYTKVGLGMHRDLQAVEALRRGGGEQVELRCDANESWTPGTALRMAHAMTHLRLQYIEQPIRMRAISELATLRGRSPVPIAANQSSWLNWDILDILRANAADVIMTDPWQAGGIANFQKAAAMCETAGLPLVYHSFAPLSIATRAAMQVLSVSPACIYAHQTYHHMLKDDVVKQPVHIQQGHIAMDDLPGLGVELNASKINQYHEAYQKIGYSSAYDNDNAKGGKVFFMPNQ